MTKLLLPLLSLSLASACSSASPLSSLSFSGVKQDQTPSEISAQQQSNKLINFGKSLIGTPYVYGGTTTKGFDCSGLVQYVFNHAGVKLPRTSRAQYSALEKVSKPQIGDLVFFKRGARINHVGIYVGNNKMLHAPSSGKTVEITNMDSPYWQKRYAGARRVSDNLRHASASQLVVQKTSSSSARHANRVVVAR